jgi:4-amino-4-deoxy-L-arabinose transferase
MKENNLSGLKQPELFTNPRSILLLLLLFVLLYIAFLGYRPLFFPDETRYAEIAREMIVTGDYVVPRLNEIPYLSKPPLGMWLVSLSISLLGKTNFAARLPSALAVGMTAFLIFLIVSGYSRERLTALFSGGAFLTSGLALAVGTTCILDGFLTLLVTGGLVCFFFAYLSKDLKNRLLLLFLFGLFLGLSFLVKGFLAFVLPAIVIVPFLIWEKKAKRLLTLPWIPLATAVIIIAPWALMIASREVGFWDHFVFTEHLQRFMGSELSPKQADPFWYYLPVLLGEWFPWTVLLASAFIGMKEIGLKEPLVRFLFLWLVMPFLLFSTSAGKLGTYILPCLVPLSILTVIGTIRSLEMKRDKPFFIGTLVLTILLPLIVLLIVVNEAFDPIGIKLFGEGESAKKIILIILGIGFWVSMLLLALYRKETKTRLALFLLGPVIFFAIHPFLVPGGALGETAPGDSLLSHRDLITPDTILISEKEFPSAVAWYYDRSDVRFLTKTGYTVSAGLSYMENSSDYILGLERTQKIIMDGDKRVFIILSKKYYERYRESLTAPDFLDERGGLVFLGYF